MVIKRTILKQEFAHKLFPDCVSTRASMQKLRKEIKENPNLSEKLYQRKNSKKVHYYTNQQVKVVLEHFCLSNEEFAEL